MLYYNEIPFEKRIQHIEYIFKHCRNKTVLDIGCAEGLISIKMINSGASSVHGFDISKERIKKANSYKIKNSHFSVCDLSDWDSFTKQKILKNYDIVLFLGTYHHLNENRDIILNNLLNMCSEYFLFRTAFSNKQIPENIIKKNFKRITRFIWKRS